MAGATTEGCDPHRSLLYRVASSRRIAIADLSVRKRVRGGPLRRFALVCNISTGRHPPSLGLKTSSVRVPGRIGPARSPAAQDAVITITVPGSSRRLTSPIDRMPQLCKSINASGADCWFLSPQLSIGAADTKIQNNFHDARRRPPIGRHVSGEWEDRRWSFGPSQTPYPGRSEIGLFGGSPRRLARTTRSPCDSLPGTAVSVRRDS